MLSDRTSSNIRFLLLTLIPYSLSALLEGASFAFIYNAFTALNVSVPTNSLFPFFGKFDVLDDLTSEQVFYFNVLLAIAVQCFRSLVNFWAVYETTSFSLKIQAKLQNRVYQQVLRFSYPFSSELKIGELSETMKAPSLFVPVLFAGINQCLVSVFMSAGLVTVLLCIFPALTLISFVCFAVFASIQKFAVKKLLIYSRILSAKLFDLSHESVQGLLAIRSIHIFNRRKYFLNKMHSLLEQLLGVGKKAYFWSTLIPSISEVLNILLVGVILIIGSVFLEGSDSSLPSLLTYIILIYRLATRLQTVVSTIGGVGLHYGTIIRLKEFLEDKGKQYVPDPYSKIQFKGWGNLIEFRDVSFKYPGATIPLFEGLSFTIRKGETTAIVGLSGAGKSSILDLLLALQIPHSGDILIDGESLNLFSQESWRDKIGFVNQDVFVFNGTIRENILFGASDVSLSYLKEVEKLVGIEDLMSNLPDGYDTIIGERGYKLSGGQRQRLALARALLKNPELLIIDEATSNLDSLSENLILSNLMEYKDSKTFVFVAHRLSTITSADIIYLIERGRILASGNHETLLRQSDLYAQLWSLQSRQACK